MDSSEPDPAKDTRLQPRFGAHFHPETRRAMLTCTLPDLPDGTDDTILVIGLSRQVSERLHAIQAARLHEDHDRTALEDLVDELNDALTANAGVWATAMEVRVGNNPHMIAACLTVLTTGLDGLDNLLLDTASALETIETGLTEETSKVKRLRRLLGS